MKWNPASSPTVPAPGGADAVFQQAVQLHQQGRPFQADAVCVQVLAMNARHPGALHLKGLLALEVGDVETGIAWIERSLKAQPRQPAAHSNIGNALMKQGQSDQALARFERALTLKPDYPTALFNKGNALRALSRPTEALASFDAALKLHPADATYLNNRALALIDLGRHVEAVAVLEEAIARSPAYLDAHVNLVSTLLGAGRAVDSLAACDRLMALHPRDPQAWFHRGNALVATGEAQAAVEHFERALQLRPEFVDFLVNRAAALLTLDRPTDALIDLEHALQLSPDSPIAWSNAGNALLALGQSAAALDRYDAALRLAPGTADTLYNRGAALRNLQRFSEAGDAYQAVLAISPDHALAAESLFHVQLDCCDWSRYEELRARVRRDLERQRRITNPLSGLLLDSPQLQFDCARGHIERQYPESRQARRLCADPEAGVSRRLRVAYVSADFREHPVSHLLTGVLAHHDRSAFEIVGVALAAADGSAQGERMRAACDEVIDGSNMSDAAVVAALRGRGIDLAVDLMGLTQGTRLGIFAKRAAAAQVGYLGYPGTIGAPFMDYLIADETVVAPDAEQWYTERIVRLPGCYLPYEGRREGPAPMTRAQAGLPEEAFVFSAFTSAFKISPGLFAIWMGLLREVPHSVLWLRALPPEACANLKSAAQVAGVDAARLIFAPRLDNPAQYLARLTLADLCLDTTPYNSHSTACDTLWSGVPLVTCTGQGFAGRVAASALRAAAMPELVADNLAHYRSIALQLAFEPQRLRGLREKLLEQRDHLPLFDIGRYTRQLELVFRDIHRRPLRETATPGAG